jgi:hypothetical protein
MDDEYDVNGSIDPPTRYKKKQQAIKKQIRNKKNYSIRSRAKKEQKEADIALKYVSKLDTAQFHQFAQHARNLKQPYVKPSGECGEQTLKAREKEIERITGDDVVGQLDYHMERHPEHAARYAPPVVQLQVIIKEVHVPVSVPTQVTLQQSAAVYVHNQCSTRRYDDLLKILGNVGLKPRKEVKKIINEVIPNVKIKRFGEGKEAINMVTVSLSESIELTLKYDLRYREKLVKNIKIMCDCAHDLKEKYGKKRALLVVGWSFTGDHGDIKDNDDHTTRPLRAAWCGESHGPVIPMVNDLQEELDALSANGLDVEGRHYTFSFNYCADYKAVLLTYGKGASGSSYPCIWCDSHRKKLNRGQYKPNDHHRASPSDIIDPNDPIQSIMPTYALMKQIAEQRAKNREEKMENDDASYRNMKYVPALNIDPKDCYPEPLHMRLRIVGLFERIRARMAGIDPSTLHANVEYKQLLKKLGIYRGMTGVTGGECRLILEGRDTFCEGVKKHSKHVALLECMRMFHWLDTHQTNETSPQEWKKFAREFRRLMMKNFQRWCGASIYLHILATHGYRFMPLHSFSTQALERMHVLFKQAKRGWSVDDKKEESDTFTYHQNTKQLCQMMKWVLSRSCSWHTYHKEEETMQQMPWNGS